MDEYGKKRQKPFYGESQREAKEKARAFQQELERGLDLNGQNTTVEAWLEKWLDLHTAGKAVGTHASYRPMCGAIVEAIGDKKLKDVKEVHLQAILSSFSGYSKSHISKLKNTIKMSFASAERNGLIVKNPALYIESPKGTYVGHRALEPWEIDLLLTHWRVRRAGFWAALMLLTGLRRGEACALRIEDYDPENSMLYVYNAVHVENNKMVESGTTKTEAGLRELPLVGPIVDIVDEYIVSGNHTFFLEDAEGNPLTESALRRGWQSLELALTKIANGIDPNVQIRNKDRLTPVHFTPHDLRYTYATMLYDAGVDEKTAQLWMGHTGAEMTRDLYAQLTAERAKRSTDSLHAYMDKLRKTDPI